jgi:dihydrofolate reductase
MTVPKEERPSSRLTARISICCWVAEPTISGAAFGRARQKSPMADAINGATKYIATHRPDSLTWGPQLIVWGSSMLTPVLLEHELADEILLLVFPVLLGTGKRIFSDGTPPREFKLVSSKAVASGVIISAYKPNGPLRSGTMGA